MRESPLQTHVITPGMRVARVIYGSVNILLGLFVPFFRPFNGPGDALFLLLFGLVFVLYGLYLVLNSFFYRLEVGEGFIRRVGILGQREIRLENLEGYEGVKRRGVLFFREKGRRRALTVFLNLTDQDGLLDWARTHGKDLVQVRAEEETDKISQDERLGTNPEDRKAALGKIKRLWKFVMPAFLVMFFWGWVHPKPYLFFTGLWVLFPWGVIFLIHYFPAYFRLNAPSNSPYLPVDMLISMPGFFLAMRALLDWHVLDWTHFWAPFGAITLSLWIAALTLVPRENWKNKSSALLFGFICAVYGSGATVLLNGTLDRGAWMTYPTTLLDSRFSGGKTASYYGTLKPWGPVTETKEWRISRWDYENKTPGAPVTVYVKPGALKIPYYFIR